MKGYTLELEVIEGENHQTVSLLVNKFPLTSAQAKTVRGATEKAASAALELLRDPSRLIELLNKAAFLQNGCSSEHERR